MPSGLEVELSSADGARCSLQLSTLPGAQEVFESPDPMGLVTLREARRYRYKFTLDEPIAFVEPAELFDPDDHSWATGRMAPGEAVGIVALLVTTESGRRYEGGLDVRSAKFADETAFATMLADLAALSVEALHQGFAPSSGTFTPEAGSTPRLLYQQFAMLNALLKGTDLRWAIEQVLAQPHRAWQVDVEPRQPGRPLRGSSRLSTQLSRPGPRIPTPAGPLASLPRTLLVQRTEETLDTLPNRFVRFVLERWRALAATILTNADSLPGAARRRGLGEAKGVVHALDEVLGNSLFREVGRLSVVPGDNQVLRRREGYRQIAAAAALIEGSLGLELDIEDPFLVSRKSIATLYEYWTFVRLAIAVAKACGSPGLWHDLFKPSPSGMSLVLKAGATARMKFETQVEGQPVRADLFFNREFREGSWTRPMRPDASLVIRRPGDREVWLHFDAKYKVDWQRPFDTGDTKEEEEAEQAGTSKRTDLLKMHAYRDAIRNSAGSYILFPGSDVAEFAMNTAEFLPGLGAFPLRPDRAEDDGAALKHFVSRALRHVAAAGTRHRRASFWETRAFAEQGTDAAEAAPPAGDLPPADTPVLVGYVRSDAHWAWVRRAHLYNLRSGERPGAVTEGDRPLETPLIVLHGQENGRPVRELFRRTNAWTAVTNSTIRRLGYPDPRGDAYLVTALERLNAPRWLEQATLSDLAPRGWILGAPFVVSWLDLVLAAA